MGYIKSKMYKGASEYDHEGKYKSCIILWSTIMFQSKVILNKC